MRKSLASLNWTVAVLFTGIGLFGQSAAAQAPVYRASDFVKPVTTGQSVAYQGEVAAYPVAQTRVLDQASASSGYGSPTSGTLQGRGAVGSGAASRGSGGCACGDSQWSAAANALFLFRNDPASSVLA
ncbi:MAG: hypothetical protein KDA51_08610, partial [Planctomycetales bacterium]|nr:hypothetical protein [Planctomycetales bacterium]